MWIKTSDGKLVNLDTGTVLAIKKDVLSTYSVILELPQRDFNDIYLKYNSFTYRGEEIKTWSFDDGGGDGDGINFEYKWLETFETEKEAKDYLDKLAKKLGAEEV